MPRLLLLLILLLLLFLLLLLPPRLLNYLCLQIEPHSFLSRLRPDSPQLVFCNGLVLHRLQCQQSFGDWLDAIVEFSRALHAAEIDISAFACLCALTLVNGE